MNIELNLKGVRDIADTVKQSMDTAEEQHPLLTTSAEVTGTILGGTTAVLAVKSGLTRLARNEATYGGFGPVVTVAAGVGVGALSLGLGLRAAKTSKKLAEKYGIGKKKDDKSETTAN